jgi:hypothetical protein
LNFSNAIEIHLAGLVVFLVLREKHFATKELYARNMMGFFTRYILKRSHAPTSVRESNLIVRVHFIGTHRAKISKR